MYFVTIIVVSGLHTNYDLMEELISCKKAVAKVMFGAPNVWLWSIYFSAFNANFLTEKLQVCIVSAKTSSLTILQIKNCLCVFLMD